jgi:ferredoxin-NADP reductase
MTTETIPLRLTGIRYAATDINLYEFRHPDGRALPPATPGAHVDLHLPTGLLRQYSLVTVDRDPRAYVVGVKRDRDSRGGSSHIHDRLRVGQMLEVGGPRNNFPLIEDAAHTVLIAGGIGITPIWCMAQRLIRLGRPFDLHYACRTRDEAAFLDDLLQRSEARLHFDAESGGRFLDVEAVIASAPAASHFYCCGPGPMLDAYEAATAPLPAERVHVEYFSGREAVAVEGGYVVELHRTGERFEIPAGKTILQVLRDAGVAAPYSCEEGICGACQVTVVAGTPDHRDSVLGETERRDGKTMMICCSGSKSERLVIDF